MRGASHGWMVMGLSLVTSPVSDQGSLAPKKSLETSSCVCLMVCVEQEIAGVGWGGEIGKQWARNEAGHLCILEGRLSALSLRLIPATTFSTFSLCPLHASLCIPAHHPVSPLSLRADVSPLLQFNSKRKRRESAAQGAIPQRREMTGLTSTAAHRIATTLSLQSI